MWWLTGIYYKRHPQADTKKRVMATIKMIVEDIASGDVVGAYVHRLHDVPLLFSHAGFSKPFYDYLKRQIAPTSLTDSIAGLLSSKPKGLEDKLTPEQIMNYTNDLLRKVVGQCSTFPCRMNEDRYELFEAGRDRGGPGIGGPL